MTKILKYERRWKYKFNVSSWFSLFHLNHWPYMLYKKINTIKPKTLTTDLPIQCLRAWIKRTMEMGTLSTNLGSSRFSAWFSLSASFSYSIERFCFSSTRVVTWKKIKYIYNKFNESTKILNILTWHIQLFGIVTNVWCDHKELSLDFQSSF